MITFIGFWAILSGIGIIGFVTQYPESWMTWLGISFGIFIIIGGIIVLRYHEENERTAKDYGNLRASFSEIKDESDILNMIVEVMSEMNYSELIKLKNRLVQRDTEILDIETFQHIHVLYEEAIDRIDNILATKASG